MQTELCLSKNDVDVEVPKWISPKRVMGRSLAKVLVFRYGKRPLKLSVSAPAASCHRDCGFLCTGRPIVWQIKEPTSGLVRFDEPRFAV